MLKPMPTEIGFLGGTARMAKIRPRQAHGPLLDSALVVVPVLNTDNVPREGLPVYVFDGTAYTGYHGVTDAAGHAVFTLPQGDYRFRSDLNGTQFWSGETDDCGIPGCFEASVTVTIPLTVIVQSETGSPYPDLPVYAFDGDSYTGYHGTSDENGQVVLTLPAGDYRFRADYDGVQFWSGLANHCTIPGCLEALVEIPGGVGGPVSVTIDYSYDPLQRLVAADYSTGEFFHYSYDAVGNRLTQEALAGTNVYTYDIANRLVEVDGVTYTWDDNGNLLEDGLREYAYDHANRLISVEMGADSYEFGYNGLGDRLRQTVNGTLIDYTLDLAAGLTQVLSDGDNAYLYGVGRIGEQQPEGWQYHLGDALGSLRQLGNVSPSVGQSAAYEPFGNTLASGGEAHSTYGFTGEASDRTELLYLRARYLSTPTGRFVARDLSAGTDRLPITLNKYIYARDNPTLYADPNGLCPAPQVGTGKVICIDLFIQTPTIVFGLGFGDGRGFDANSAPGKSRGYVYLYLDDRDILLFEEPHIDNPSCTTIGCFGPYPEYNEFLVTQLHRGQPIDVTWSLLNGFSGFLRCEFATLLSLLGERFLVFRLASTASEATSYVFLSEINGSLSLSINAEGDWELASLDRDPYPSLEIYYYEEGELLYTIAQRGEWPSEHPEVGLSPLAPTDRIP